MTSRNRTAFTLVEFLVLLAVVFVLIILLMPGPTGGLVKGQQTQTLSNMKQLHLATQQMSLDGFTTGDTNLGWPGDIGGIFTNWTEQLLKGSYLSSNDLRKLLSAPGVIIQSNTVLSATDTALLVYAVSTNSPGTAVFLSTANFTNTHAGGIVNPKAKPYEDKGFIVFRKAGDGAILQSRQAGNTNIVGSYVPLCR